jgi:hypothetical protein
MRILAKLIDAMNHRLLDAFKRGRAMAVRASKIASDWGYIEAVKWSDELEFQLALGNGIVLGN